MEDQKNEGPSLIQIREPGVIIDIQLDGKGGGSITSNLKSDPDDGIPDDGDEFYDAAIDGIEALIMAHACSGVDVADRRYIDGILAAVEGAANNF